MLASLILVITLGSSPLAVTPHSAVPSLAAKPMSGHQPIIKFPEAATGSYQYWPDSNVKFEVRSGMPISCGLTELTLQVNPPLKGAPTKVTLDGGIGWIVFRSPSSTGYYNFTLSGNCKGTTFYSTFVLDVALPTGTGS